MNTIYYDTEMSDDLRRQKLYQGQLFVYSPRPSTVALCEFARQMSCEAFAPHHPQQAQHHMEQEQYIEILAKLKPAFIHHPESKRLIQAVLEELGCDMQKTFFDVPRLRTATAGGYLTSGLAYAFKPHRDTWYSTPMCQLNWWLPVFEIESDNIMAFHPHYWDRAIKNSSNEFDYGDWNRVGRASAANQSKKKQDTRKQSAALEPLTLEPEIRIVCPPGGLIIFSAAHLHSTVENTTDKTRISMDFRTTHLDELRNQTGAHNIDSHCSGTTIHDYLRGDTLEHVPKDVIAMYEDHPMTAADLSPQFRDQPMTNN